MFKRLLIVVFASVTTVSLFGPLEMALAASGDFNGDGYEDLAIGVPGEDIGTVINCGAVSVIYGSVSGLDTLDNKLWNQNSPGIAGGAEDYDYFGKALAAGDFNGDGFDDMATGVPGEDIGGVIDGGAVSIIYGSSSGLEPTDNVLWHQGTPGIAGGAEDYDYFGNALAAGDFDGDGYADLAVGVYAEGIGTVYDAGAVNVVYGSSIGLTSTGDQLWHQNSPGILDTAEEYDYFGKALAAGDFDGDGYDDLAIGVHREDLGTVDRAGAVNVIYGSSSGLTSTGNQFWHQGSTGILNSPGTWDYFGSTLAAGNFDGDEYTDLAIGVPVEDLGAALSAGAVNVIYGSSSGLTDTGNQFWNQNSPGIRDISEDADTFGAALAAGDIQGDGYDDLAIGVPGEEVGSVGDAGAAHILMGSGSGGLSSSRNQFLHQDVGAIEDTAEAYDYFGSALSWGDFNGNGFADLAIGVYYEDIGAVTNTGAVNVIYGIPRGSQFWHQGTPGIQGGNEDNDWFGDVLGVGHNE